MDKGVSPDDAGYVSKRFAAGPCCVLPNVHDSFGVGSGPRNPADSRDHGLTGASLCGRGGHFHGGQPRGHRHKPRAELADTVTTFNWNFGDGSTASGQSVTHTYTDCGTYTATLALDDAGNPYNDAQVPLITTTVRIVKVEKVELVAGATMIGDGPNTPADTDVCAEVKGTGYVVLEAKICPTGSPLPACFAWSEGEAVPGNPLQRRVPKASPVKKEVTATCGTSHAHMLVYVIGAEPAGFSPANGTSGPNFPNDSYQWDELYTSQGGTHPDVFGPCTTFMYPWFTFSLCQIEFKIKPDALYTDGTNGLFLTSDIPAFAVRRNMRTKTAISRSFGPLQYVSRNPIHEPDPELGV